VQNRQRDQWSESKVNDRLRHTMRDSLDEVQKLATEKHVTWRTAAYMLAITRVARAVEVNHPDF
jgi:glutamate dehydrogenase/leucine dehydrogenase